ncbi:MAG: response regulator transcription factor [Propionibacteriales bacterium]|nr:response regulator transcription factor [Propionibacteriales bacterium]
MARILLFTDAATSSEVLPSLGLLSHQVRTVPAQSEAVLNAPESDLWLLDARASLLAARTLCRILAQSAPCPLFVVVDGTGLAALSPDWGFGDFVLPEIGPAELSARLTLALSSDTASDVITTSGIVVDELAYSAKLHGRTLDLTYTEFELLKFLAQNPGHVFTRQQLLSDVWGYDYFGGTRTVDVHIRRLRAKLGPDHETMIETIRNVGYRLAAR